MRSLEWSNPHGIELAKPFVYFVRVLDDEGREFRYVGKARDVSRLREYVRNVAKIFAGRPRGAAQGYRAVHLALAHACQHGWKYEFHPLESASREDLNSREAAAIARLKCNLNGASTWQIHDYPRLRVPHLLR